MTDVFEAAQGRWLSILPALGIAKDFLTGRNCPCPVCGGKDRFRFTDFRRKGNWICNQCRPEPGGDGFDLLQAVHSWDVRRATDEVKAIVGTAPITQKRKSDPDRLREERKTIWSAGHHLTAVEAVRLWWMNRVGFVPDTPELRAADSLYHHEAKSRHPGMLARVLAPDGKRVVQIHRTFLTPDGSKADVDPPRLLMTAIEEGEMNGGAVRLAPFTDHLGIAEGVETAVAVTKMFGVPCWAALNAGNLVKWAPPAGVRVTIYGDNDSHKTFAGQLAAYTLANRLRREGVDVDDVQIPSGRGEDWNDAWAMYRDLPPANDDQSERKVA